MVKKLKFEQKGKVEFFKLTQLYKINKFTVLKKRSYDSSSSVANPLRWMNANEYDIFLGCSSRNRIDLAWINHRAAPQLQLAFYFFFLRFLRSSFPNIGL